MLQAYPASFSRKAITLYIVLLVAVSILGHKSVMAWYFMAIGLTAVYAFFHYAAVLPVKWRFYNEARFEKKLFKTALVIRVIYVFASYAFYWIVTDTPFDFESADAVYYHSSGVDGHWLLVNYPEDYWRCMIVGDFADCGYPIYLSFLYVVLGDSILLTRVFKSLLGAFMCVFVYRLASRNFDVQTGRLAGIMFMLMPNAIFYCGNHLKEAEMVFLVLLFAERADNLLRSKHYSLLQFAGVFFIACLLFFFRTALAVVLIVAFIVAGLMTSKRVVGVAKRSIMIAVAVIGSVIILGTGIASDISHEWNRRDEQAKNYEWRAERGGGNYLIKYASASIFAPLIFTLPFPTMVDIPGQEHTQMIQGGNYVKNIISVFTILALLTLLKNGRWRENVLILAIMLGYLGAIAISQFAQSERFHFPALPFVIIFAAYGITHLKGKHIKYYNLWMIAMFVACLGWNFIKLKGRGMI